MAASRHPMDIVNRSLTLSTLVFWTHLSWANEFFWCSWHLRACCLRRDCRHALKAATSHLLRLPLPQQEAQGTPQRQCVMALPQQLLK